MTGVHDILLLLHLSSQYLCLTIRSRTWTLQHDTIFYLYYIYLDFVLPFGTWTVTGVSIDILLLYYIYLVSTFVLPFDLERGRFSMTGVHDILLLLHLSRLLRLKHLYHSI